LNGAADPGFPGRAAPRAQPAAPPLRPGNLLAISSYNIDNSEIVSTLRVFRNQRNACPTGAAANAGTRVGQRCPCRNHRNSSRARATRVGGLIFRFVYCEFFM